MMSVVSVAKQRKTRNHKIKSCIVKKYILKPNTEANDPKECEKCGDKF